MNRRHLIDILESVFFSMNLVVTINGVVTTGTTHVISCEDVKYAQVGRKITIDGNEYTITEVDHQAETITCTGDEAIVVGSFTLYEPFFFYGTPIQQGVELNAEDQARDKTPMVWLLESFTEDFTDDIDNPIERTVTPRLFFVTEADFENYTTAQAKDLYIRPMMRLRDMFIAQIKATPRVFEVIDELAFSGSDYNKFGVYITNKGAEKSMWADKLSGIECAPDLKIYKEDPCIEGGSGIDFMQIENDFIVS